MTTIIVCSAQKTIYSDSRWKRAESGKTWYANGGQKIFKHKSGKLLAGHCGDVGIALPELRRLGFIVNITDVDEQTTMSGCDNCSLFIINKWNDHILQLEAKKNIITNKVRFEREYMTSWNRVWAGSGANIVSKVMESVPDMNEGVMIHYAAMVDKGTNDVVCKVGL